MISAAQLRAARGLLDWTRADLAKASGLSPETIKNIEHGIFKPTDLTTQAIVNAFVLHDVEFSENNGVRVRQYDVKKYDGVEGFKQFMDDVYKTALDPACGLDGDKPFCMSNLDDSFFIKYLGDFFTVFHVGRMNALRQKFKMYILIKERPLTYSKEESEYGSYREYRVQPKHVEGNVPFYVYGDKLAILIFDQDKEPTIVVINSGIVAKAYREQFNVLWETAKPLKMD